MPRSYTRMSKPRNLIIRLAQVLRQLALAHHLLTPTRIFTLSISSLMARSSTITCQPSKSRARRT